MYSCTGADQRKKYTFLWARDLDTGNYMYVSVISIYESTKLIIKLIK